MELPNSPPMPLRGSVVYVCYPFRVKPFNEHAHLVGVLDFLYSQGLIPVVCSIYMKPHGIVFWNWRVAKLLISKCDAVVLFYESHITEMMMREVLYAKELHVPVFKMYVR